MRKFRLAIILVILHAFLVTWVWWSVHTSSDGEAGMLWLLFAFIDWPSTAKLTIEHPDSLSFASGIFLLGSFQWFLLGFGLQTLFRRLTNSSREGV